MLPYQNLSLQDMPGEVWKDVTDYDGLYKVSNLGRVKTADHINFVGKHYKEKVLRVSPNKKGYLVVRLYNKGACLHHAVARLVAKAFVDNPENKPTVDHINTDVKDNRAVNLQWATHHENQMNPISRQKRKEMFRRENMLQKMIKPKRGADNSRARKVIAVHPKTLEIRTYSYMQECAKDGFTPANVSKVCRKLMKHSSGWLFFYADDPEVKAYLPNLFQSLSPTS